MGDLDKNILPNTADLEKLRDLVTQAIQNPPFAIFFPPILKYEALGVSGKLLSIKADYEYIWRQYTVGLGVSEDIILGDSGIFSSTETSSNQAFIRARKKDRDQMEEWMRRQFFEPLARWNNLKLKKGSQLAYILPTFEWEKTLDFAAEKQNKETSKYMWEKGVYPTKRWLSESGKNAEEIELELKEEINSVFDDHKRILAPAIRGAKVAPAGGAAGGAAGGGAAGAGAAGAGAAGGGAAGAGAAGAGAAEAPVADEAAGAEPGNEAGGAGGAATAAGPPPADQVL